MWHIIEITFLSSIAVNLFCFVIAYSFQTDKLTDISYAISFLTIAAVSLISVNKLNTFSYLLFAMVTLWAFRIGSFLLLRVIRVGRDRRFDNMRSDFIRFGKFWLGQAITAWILMLPVSLALYNGVRQSLLIPIGLFVWSIGLIIEAVADYQKLVFKLNIKNKGKWIDEGLWKNSRHPNYFGEILVWWGIYLACFISLNLSERLFGLASPVLITLLLLKVSGVPILEKSADKRWGQFKEYREYKERSRILIPLPK